MTEEEAQDPPFAFRRPQLGLVDQPVETEESKSVGTGSSPSSLNDPKPTESSMQDSPKPALTTESHSNPTVQADSSVSSTDGDTQRDAPRQSSRPRKSTPAKRTARVRSTDDEVDEFDI